MLRWRPRYRHPDRAGLIEPIGSAPRGRPLSGGVRCGARLGRASAAALVVLLASLTGCGGSEQDPGEAPSAQPESLTKPAFIHRADEICLFYETRIEAAGDDLLDQLPPSGKPTNRQLERFAEETVVPSLESTIDGIADLPAPAGDESEIERILNRTSEAVDQIEADPAALADGNPPALIEAGRLARRYGSSECGASDRAAYLQDS